MAEGGGRLKAQPARAVMDACVLYPTVMREVLLSVAREGLFVPLWSDRILEEWARAAARHGALDEVQARGEIAVLRAHWPDSSVAPHAGLAARLWLPDDNDIHVLSAAIAGNADLIVTNNAKDFPRNILAEEGLDRRDPDQMLHGLWQDHPATVARAVARVQAEAIRQGGPTDLRLLLKKAKLPRLGKALAA